MPGTLCVSLLLPSPARIGIPPCSVPCALVPAPWLTQVPVLCTRPLYPVTFSSPRWPLGAPCLLQSHSEVTPSERPSLPTLWSHPVHLFGGCLSLHLEWVLREGPAGLSCALGFPFVVARGPTQAGRGGRVWLSPAPLGLVLSQHPPLPLSFPSTQKAPTPGHWL